MRPLRPAFTLCLSFLLAKGGRSLRNSTGTCPRRVFGGTMVPEWGSVEPLGLPAPDQVVSPSPPTAQGETTAGRAQGRQPSSFCTGELRAPCHWASHGARGPVDLLTLSFFSGNSLHTGVPRGFIPGTPPGPLGRLFGPFGMSQSSCLVLAIPFRSERGLISASSSTPERNRNHLAVAMWQRVSFHHTPTPRGPPVGGAPRPPARCAPPPP